MPAHQVGGGGASEDLNPNFGLEKDAINFCLMHSFPRQRPILQGVIPVFNPI